MIIKNVELQIIIDELKEEVQNLKNEVLSKDVKLAECEKQLDYHKDIVKKAALKSTTTVNNTNNGIISNKQTRINSLVVADLSAENVQKQVTENFTKEHFNLGVKGVALFAKDNLLKDEDGNPKMICTDVSRLIFMSKNKEGEVQKDPKATKFGKIIYKPVVEKSKIIHKEVTDKYYEDYKDCDEVLSKYVIDANDKQHEIKKINTTNVLGKEMATALGHL